MKLERDVKDRIKEILNAMGVWWFMYVPVGYGKSGIPDFLCCYQGHFVSIEAKFGGEKPTPLQESQMKVMRAAGAVTLVINEKNVEDLPKLIVEACS